MPKVILISGGSDGLGKAIAQKLSPHNQVIILAHNREKLIASAKEIGCDFVEAELIDYSSLKSAVDQVVSKYHRVDVLVNNAGVWIEGQLEENDPAKIKNVVDVNTTGTIFLTKAVLPQLRTQKSGQIINIVSQDGLCAKKDRSVYHASKWALTGFTKCLQEDVAGENIKVTAIYPGLMKTALFEKNNVDRDLSDALDPAEVASLIETVINLDETAYVPEVSIKNITNIPKTMDNTTAPIIDLNIDPDMMTTQGSSPQLTPPTTVSSAPSVTTPGVIDITPSPTQNITSPVSVTPIQPEETLPHLSVLNPEPLSEENAPEAIPTAVPEPVITAPAVIPSETAPIPVQSAPEPTTQTIAAPAVQGALAEDPDLVKLVK
jgi:NADP-dependent 3-hydroxy acid dehydrogenase YdfG